MSTTRHAVAFAALLLLGSAAPAAARQAQDGSQPDPVLAKLPANAMAVPFAVGERMSFDVKFGPIKAGSGSMEVRDIVDVRGVPSWHTAFRFTGGIPFFKVDDTFESWFDVVTLSSRRHFQTINEGNYKPRRQYEIFSERGMYRLNQEEERVTAANPLDDGSMLYFVRTLPLEVGKSYTIPRYFKPEGNPVTIAVVRRETIEVPAGKFATVVLQPTFQTKGLFSKNGRAEVWISDDDRRLVVQMKSQLSFGSINLYLKSHNVKQSR